MGAEHNEKYSEGHFLGLWMGVGIAIFSVIGIPLSILTGNYAFIGVGPGLGVAVGLSIGQGVENKYKKEGRIRPLTAGERKRRKKAVLAGWVLLALGALVFFSILLFR